jgi:hypothetical protein
MKPTDKIDSLSPGNQQRKGKSAEVKQWSTLNHIHSIIYDKLIKLTILIKWDEMSLINYWILLYQFSSFKILSVSCDIL